MKFKTKLILSSAVLGALIVAYISGTLFSYGMRSRIKEITIFPGLKQEQVSSISMKSPEASVVLTKVEAGKWTVQAEGTTFPADPGKIDTFFSSVTGLKQRRVASKNAENTSNFDLSDDKAGSIALTDKEGRTLAELFIGKETGGGNYVRLSKSETVVTTNKSLTFYVTQNRDYWTNLKLFPEDLKGTAIDRISVASEGIVLEKDGSPVRTDFTLFKTVEKKVDVWKMQGNESFEVDQNAAEVLANTLAGFRVRSFVGLKEESLVKNPSAKALAEIRFSTSANASYDLTVYPGGGEDEFLLILDSSPYLYTVANWTLQAVIKGTEELKAPIP